MLSSVAYHDHFKPYPANCRSPHSPEQKNCPPPSQKTRKPPENCVPATRSWPTRPAVGSLLGRSLWSPTSWYSHACGISSLWTWPGPRDSLIMSRRQQKWRGITSELSLHEDEDCHLVYFLAFSLAPSAMLWPALWRGPSGKKLREAFWPTTREERRSSAPQLTELGSCQQPRECARKQVLSVEVTTALARIGLSPVGGPS